MGANGCLFIYHVVVLTSGTLSLWDIIVSLWKTMFRCLGDHDEHCTAFLYYLFGKPANNSGEDVRRSACIACPDYQKGVQVTKAYPDDSSTSTWLEYVQMTPKVSCRTGSQPWPWNISVFCLGQHPLSECSKTASHEGSLLATVYQLQSTSCSLPTAVY